MGLLVLRLQAQRPNYYKFATRAITKPRKNSAKPANLLIAIENKRKKTEKNMKKSLHILVALFLGIFLTGCVVSSIYPFYTNKDVAFDPALVANWTNTKEAGEHWNFERAG